MNNSSSTATSAKTNLLFRPGSTMMDQTIQTADSMNAEIWARTCRTVRSRVLTQITTLIRVRIALPAIEKMVTPARKSLIVSAKIGLGPVLSAGAASLLNTRATNFF